MNVRQPRNECQCSLSTVWDDKKNQIKTLFIRSTRPDRRLNRLDMFVIRLLRPDRITHDLGSLYHYIFPQALRRMQTTGTALRAETASADDRQLPVICLHPPCNSR